MSISKFKNTQFSWTKNPLDCNNLIAVAHASSAFSKSPLLMEYKIAGEFFFNLT